MLLHIPHSSAYLPIKYEKLPQETINQFTDWYTNELFVHSAADRFVFPYSCFYADVERLENDPLDLFGCGLFYTMTPDLETEYREKDSEFGIVKKIYDNWHKALKQSISKNLSYTEKVVLVDCHSFSDDQAVRSMPWHSDSAPFASICIGHNDSIKNELLDLVVNGFEDQGLSVSVNHPYSNSLQPSGEEGFDSIMIEVNKRLYMEDDLAKSRNFIATKNAIQKVLDQISKYEMGE